MHRDELQAATKNAEYKSQVKGKIGLEFGQLKRLLNHNHYVYWSYYSTSSVSYSHPFLLSTLIIRTVI